MRPRELSSAAVGRVVWCLAELAEVPEDDRWLGPVETEVLAGLRLPKRRADWRLGRFVAKRVAATFLDAEPAEIEVVACADGAPEVRLRGRPADLTLSLSHAGGRGLAVASLAAVALGCDLEVVEPRSNAFVRDYLTAVEVACVKAAPVAERTLLANLVWSAKESALKAKREGLRLDTRRVEVSWSRRTEAEGWRRLEVRDLATGEIHPGHWRRDGTHVLTLVGLRRALEQGDDRVTVRAP